MLNNHNMPTNLKMKDIEDFSTRYDTDGKFLEFNFKLSVKCSVEGRKFPEKVETLICSSTIQFIFKGKVLPDNLKFAKIGIHPKKDVITVMATQAGGI